MCAVVDYEPSGANDSTLHGSEPWGSGTGTDEVGTLGRAWLITIEQMVDVWRQENAGIGPESIGVDRLDPDTVVATGRLDLEQGRYRRLEHLGPLDGRPVFTVTGGPEMIDHLNEPSSAYLEVVTRGLVETWGLSADEAAAYIAAATSWRRSKRR